MPPAKSTRVSIAKQGLTDILERLSEMEPCARVRELRAKAMAYERVVRNWDRTPPSEEQRGAMMKCVIDLNVETMNEGRTPPTDRRE
ncbi:MAG: hypothetical protein ABI551_24920 [Polyangiaceae bacterium]